MKISVDINIYYEVEDDAINEILKKQNYTLEDFRKMMEIEMYDDICRDYKQDDEEIIKQDIKVKVYLEQS